MNTNYKFQQHSRCLHRCLSVICSLTFLLVGLSGANAQPGTRGTVTNSLSPALRANGKIAFSSDRDGNREIYVMNSDGTDQVRLTNNPGVDDFPAWSPHGTKIAYASQNASGGFAIKLMNSDGTGQTELTKLSLDATCRQYCRELALSWSPSGTKIAFTDGFGSQTDIFTINIDGSNRVNITNHPDFDFEPSWSPDGSRILFVSSRFVSSVSFLTMHTMDVDGSDLRALPSDGQFWDMSPDWSPTGDKIVFVVNAELSLQGLYTANADGTNRQIFEGRICNGLCDYRSVPKWSPDATKIAFDLEVAFSNHIDIYVKNVDGGEPTRLTDSNSSNSNPSWQPLESAACPNPIDCAEFFVRQQYVDFLGREPDTIGFQNWVNTLVNCPNGGYGEFDNPDCDRVHVSAGFYLSEEFRVRGYWAYRFYQASLGRPPLYAEFIPDMLKIGGPQSPQQEAASKEDFTAVWLNQADFKAKYDAMDNTAYVDEVLRTANVSLANRDTLVSSLQSGQKTRAQVLREIVESKDVEDKFFIQAFVSMQYFGYLRRDPDAIGYNNWVTTLTGNPADYRHMIFGFIYSDEYRHRFGP